MALRSLPSGLPGSRQHWHSIIMQHHLPALVAASAFRQQRSPHFPGGFSDDAAAAAPGGFSPLLAGAPPPITDDAAAPPPPSLLWIPHSVLSEPSELVSPWKRPLRSPAYSNHLCEAAHRAAAAARGGGGAERSEAGAFSLTALHHYCFGITAIRSFARSQAPPAKGQRPPRSTEAALLSKQARLRRTRQHKGARHRQIAAYSSRPYARADTTATKKGGGAGPALFPRDGQRRVDVPDGRVPLGVERVRRGARELEVVEAVLKGPEGDRVHLDI